MKKLVFLLLLISPLSTEATPKWLTAIPRAVGRTYGNMFTFKHPVLALEQWATIGALAFDGKTTLDVFARCHSCTETFPIEHNQRYGVGTVVLNVALAGTLYTTSEQYGDELLRNDPNYVWRNINNSLFLVPTVYHVRAGVLNMRVKSDEEEKEDK